jgi:hypothetical protein
MSRIKNIPRPGWLVIGVLATLLVIPTTAAAVTSAVIIKGGTGAGEASVTATHQLLTNSEIQGSSGNEANVNSSGALNTSLSGVTVDGNSSVATTSVPTASTVQGTVEIGADLGSYNLPVVTALSSFDMVVTSVDVDADGLAGGRSQVLLSVDSGTTCPISFFQAVDSSSFGTTEVTYPTGLKIPAGDSLCLDQNVTGADAIVSVFGYNIAKGTEATVSTAPPNGLHVPPPH